ncbi:MAG: hypothetical protein ACOC8E_05190 [Planctomycetota bacterium]
MGKNEPLSEELGLVREGLARGFSRLPLLWQLGGTMLAAAGFAVFFAISRTQDTLAAFALNGVGLVLGYTVLWATGCVVAHVLVSAGEGHEAPGVGPLHYLIDHLRAAVVFPLGLSAGALVVALLFMLPAALWQWNIGQAILVVPSALVFAVVLLGVAALFVLLFLVPAMLAVERPGLTEAARRALGLLRTRKLALIRLFGLGLSVSALIILPAMLLVLAALSVCSWIRQAATASPACYSGFTRFMLWLMTAVLLWAPVCALALSFLNAVSLAGYRGLVGDTAGVDAPTDEDLPVAGPASEDEEEAGPGEPEE